ncbi:MAG: hypothetical protein ACKPIF_00395 [Microcystis panniformis]
MSGSVFRHFPTVAAAIAVAVTSCTPAIEEPANNSGAGQTLTPGKTFSPSSSIGDSTGIWKNSIPKTLPRSENLLSILKV